MSKILVTGFDPFGGEPVNPAFEAVKLLPESIAGVSVVKLEIPTVFTRSAMVVEEAIEREKPDYVLCIGQAGGRSAVTVEKVAINLAEARIPDNDGEQPFDTPLREDGDTAYFATLPVKAMVKRINASGIPALMSYTAGTYVCNSIMYNVLYLLDRRVPRSQGRLHPRAVRDRAGRGQAERHAHHGNHDNGQGHRGRDRSRSERRGGCHRHHGRNPLITPTRRKTLTYQPADEPAHGFVGTLQTDRITYREAGRRDRTRSIRRWDPRRPSGEETPGRTGPRPR